MNTLMFMLGGYIVLIGGTLGLKHSVEKLYPPDPNQITPAIALRDSRDFEPLGLNVSMGHYFMSIAGAAPIVAAILGLFWGWLPATLWLILAVNFLGAPSEYMQLMFSLRNKAQSLGKVSQEQIGQATGKYVSIILLFVCLLTFACMGSLLINTLASIPTAGIPTICLIPVSILFGFLLSRTSLGTVFSTVICLGIWVATIFIGVNYPLALSPGQWAIIVAIYTFFACFTPVKWLLAPRDYLNSSILVVGIMLGSIALMVGHPKFALPAFTGFESARGLLYPAIIATIGCGAINGMHAIISMGTTPKQVKNEKEAYWITAVGTRGETIIGLMAIALIASFYNYEGFLANVVSNPGPAFSDALGKTLMYLGFSETVGMVIGALTLTGFIMTTVDSYARTGRLILGELTQKTSLEKSLGNPIVGSLFVIIGGLFLLYFAPFMQLWTGFSLIAIQLTIYAYSLAVIKRIEEGKPFNSNFIRWVVIPGLFMTITTFFAMIYFLVKYVNAGNWIPSVIIVAVLGLTLLTVQQVYVKIKALLELRVKKQNTEKDTISV